MDREASEGVNDHRLRIERWPFGRKWKERLRFIQPLTERLVVWRRSFFRITRSPLLIGT